MRRPKILFFFTPASTVGGVETWLNRICCFLKQHDFECVVGLVQGQNVNDPERYARAYPHLQYVTIDGRGHIGRDESVP